MSGQLLHSLEVDPAKFTASTILGLLWPKHVVDDHMMDSFRDAIVDASTLPSDDDHEARFLLRMSDGTDYVVSVREEPKLN
jgi:hypothetical protein